MYESNDGTPYTIAEVEFYEVIEDIEEHDNFDFLLYPNPATEYVNIEAKSPLSFIEIYDLSGKLVERIVAGGSHSIKLAMPDNSGIYEIKLIYKNGREAISKVIKY